MIWLRRVARTAAWTAIVVLALVSSLAYHGRLPLARRAARDVLNRFVSSMIEGRLHVGRVDVLGPDRIVTHHVSLYDQNGRRVVVADEVDLVPDLAAAMAGTLRFASARLHHGKVHLIEGDGLPTLVELFTPVGPSTPGPGLHAVVDDIRMDDVTAYGEMLGLEGIRVEGLRAHWRLEVAEDLVIRIYSLNADMVKPFPFTGHIDRVSGTITDDPHRSVRLHVVAHAGDDRARANVVYAVPEGKPESAPGELDLLVHALPVHAETLEQMGFDWATYLHGAAYGYFRLFGPTDDLRLRASLETDAGKASLSGHVPASGPGEISARTEGIDLAALVNDAPEMHVAGRATLTIPEAAEAPSKVHLKLEPFDYRGYAVPALDVRGTLEDDLVRIDRAEGRQGGNRIVAHGTVDYDGKVDLRVRAVVPQVAREPNLARILPGAHAQLEGDVRIATATSGPERLDFDGRIVLRNLRYGPLTADWLAIEGYARGDPDHPEARLDVDGNGVALAGYPLGKARLTLRGGPHQYSLAGRFAAAGDRRLELDAAIDANEGEYAATAQRIEFAVGDLVWRGTAERVVVHPDRDVEVGRVLLANGSQRLEGSGVWRFHGPEHIEAQLQSFDLTGLQAIFGSVVPAVTGNADAHLVLDGDIDKPELLLEGALRDAMFRGVDGINLVYVFTYQNGQLALDAQADLGDRGNVTTTSSGLIDPDEPSLSAALEGGVYEVDLALADLDLGVVRNLVGPDVVPPMEGRVAGRLKASGPIQAPSFTGTLESAEWTWPGWPALAVRTEVTYENGALNGRVVTSDDHGELVEAEGSLLLDLVYLLTHPSDALPSLEAIPWRLSLRVPPRPLAELPAPLREHVPDALDALRVGASGTLAGGSFETRGDLVANVSWDPDLALRPCGKVANPRATVTLALRDGETNVKVTGQVGQASVLVAQARVPTPLDQWLRQGSIDAVPAFNATAQLREMDLGQVPWLCETFAGPVSGEVALNGMFTDRPSLRASLATNHLIIRRFRDEGREGRWSLAFQTPPLEGTADFAAGPHEAHAEARLRWFDGGSLGLTADLPMAWSLAHPVPKVADDVPLKLDARLHDVPLALLLSAVPNLVQVEGTVSGHMTAKGPPSAPDVRGEVKVHRGFFELLPMGQQIGGVEGDLAFHGDWVELRKLVAHEQKGQLAIRGALQLDGFRPSGGRIELDADDFPVRSEGAVLVNVTGKAIVDADVGPDKAVAKATLRDMALTLPDEGLRSIQGLEPHPDVQVVGQELRRTSSKDTYPIVVSVKSARPFWVRRADFAAQVAMDVGVTYLDPDFYVDGSVEIRRGFFEVFGKRFDVRQAGLQFNGGKQINPEVTLQAVHQLRSGSADTVTVTVTGRLANPQVDFATTVNECQDRGEIIALLVTGRCGRSPQEGQGFAQAGQQAASFLAGVAYGVLTLSAREQLGKNFPVIVIESGQGGRPVVRAGIDASDWVPKFLKSYVQGAYVEGFFTASKGEQRQSSPTVQGRENGFLLELQFPYNIVGTGVFSPPDAWSVDVTWEP